MHKTNLEKLASDNPRISDSDICMYSLHFMSHIQCFTNKISIVSIYMSHCHLHMSHTLYTCFTFYNLLVNCVNLYVTSICIQSRCFTFALHVSCVNIYVTYTCTQSPCFMIYISYTNCINIYVTY